MAKARRVADDRESRVESYLNVGEQAAMYLYGLADALEMCGDMKAKTVIHRLRIHASELNMGPLWVRHGYKDPPAEHGAAGGQ